MTITVTSGGSPSTICEPAPGRAALSADARSVAAFRLYDGGTTSFLGSYRSAEDAYAAADEHTLVVLTAAGGWVVVEHLLARVDADGEIRLSAEVTHVGPAEDLESCREWLRQLPGRCAARPI